MNKNIENADGEGASWYTVADHNGNPMTPGRSVDENADPAEGGMVWYTFEGRQELAAASANYDAARSNYARLQREAKMYGAHTLEKARKRVWKAERRLHEATRTFVRQVDQFFDMVGETLDDFMYDGVVAKPDSEGT